MRRRTKGRECALKILYAVDITKNDVEHAIDDFWNNQNITNKEVRDFAEYLVKGVGANKAFIDGIISTYATNWHIGRMAFIDRNILRMAGFELLFADEIPSKVTINEAVEIAKKFGDKDSGKFVNGILDKIHKEELPKKKKTEGSS